MNVAFRADAGLEIGSGHVMRCLAFADALRARGVTCRFVCRAHPGNLGGMIGRRGYDIAMLPAPADRSVAVAGWLGADWWTDAAETRRALGDEPVDWLIADHYAIDIRWETTVRGACARLMVIDDLADRSHDCDVLLDQTLGREAGDYLSLVPAACRIMTGTDYALLRPKFKRTRFLGAERRLASVETILVSLGGTDPRGLTRPVLDGLKRADVAAGIDIVAPPQPGWGAGIRWHPTVDDMASLMAGADLAIGAGGTSSWERCCLGLPSLLVVSADNQRQSASRLVAANAALELGDWKTISPVKIAATVGEVARDVVGLRRMSRHAFRVCDGLGAARVAATIEAPTARAVELRRATEADCERMYAWQIEPQARRFMRNPLPPTLAEHRDWFARTIDAPQSSLNMIHLEGEACGVVRADRIPATEQMEISILVAGAVRGRGVGTQALIQLGHLLEGMTLVADIHSENTASFAAFRAAGFEPGADGRLYRTVAPPTGFGGMDN